MAVVLPFLSAAVIAAMFLLPSKLKDGGNAHLPSTRPEISRKGISARFHVAQDHPRASDANQGTRKRPLETVGEALRRAEKKNLRGIPARVTIHPGTYREELLLDADDRSGVSYAPLIVEAREPGEVTISGSDVWTKGWRAEGNLWWRSWPYRWGHTEYPKDWENSYAAEHLRANPVIRRREMIFVNGRHLTQEISLASLRSRKDTFFVDETRGRVYVNVASDVSPNRDLVEVSTRPTLLHVHDRDDVTIRNLVFQHASSHLENKAVLFRNTSGVRVVGSNFRWNNWTGLAVEDSDDVTVVGSTANHNGNAGMTGLTVSGLNVIGSEMSFNGWRAALGIVRDQASMAVDNNLLDFAGGNKFFHLRDAFFDHLRAEGNKGSGLWLDYDNSEVVVSDSRFVDNWTQGLHIEASQGPIWVAKNAICGNETGILINNASDVSVISSTLSNNRLGQLWQAGVNEPRSVYNQYEDRWEKTESKNWTLRGNSIQSTGSQRGVGTYLTTAWDSFVNTLTSDLNVWTYQGDPRVFQVGGGELLDLAGWRAHTRQDARSVSTEEQPRCPDA